MLYNLISYKTIEVKIKLNIVEMYQYFRRFNLLIRLKLKFLPIENLKKKSSLKKDEDTSL